MGGEMCGDNRFVIIEAVKKDLIESCNISEEELKVLDSILFRLWQCGYLELESEESIHSHALTTYIGSPYNESNQYVQTKETLEPFVYGFYDGYQYGKNQLIHQIEKQNNNVLD